MHKHINTGAKILIFLCIIAAAYLFFTYDKVEFFLGNLNSRDSYISFFIAGIFFAWGFTLPISAGLILSINKNNMLLSTIIGGAGSVIGDLIIIFISKRVFAREFIRLEASREYYKWKDRIDKFFGRKISPHAFTYMFGGIVIALPIPDEIGLSFLAGLPDFKIGAFAIISFALHSAGILTLIYAQTQLF